MQVRGIEVPLLTLEVVVKGLREEVVCFMLQGRIPRYAGLICIHASTETL
jgi:hypothetical protein